MKTLGLGALERAQNAPLRAADANAAEVGVHLIAEEAETPHERAEGRFADILIGVIHGNLSPVFS